MSNIRTSVQLTCTHFERQVIVGRWERAYVVLVVGTVWAVSSIKIKYIRTVSQIGYHGVSTGAVGRFSIRLVGEVHCETAPLKAPIDLQPEGFSIELEDKSTEALHRNRAATGVGQRDPQRSSVSVQLAGDAPLQISRIVVQTGKGRNVTRTQRRVFPVAEQTVLQRTCGRNVGQKVATCH